MFSSSLLKFLDIIRSNKIRYKNIKKILTILYCIQLFNSIYIIIFNWMHPNDPTKKIICKYDPTYKNKHLIIFFYCIKLVILLNKKRGYF